MIDCVPGSLSSFSPVNPGNSWGEEFPVVGLGAFKWMSFWIDNPLLFSEGAGKMILPNTWQSMAIKNKRLNIKKFLQTGKGAEKPAGKWAVLLSSFHAASHSLAVKEFMLCKMVQQTLKTIS